MAFLSNLLDLLGFAGTPAAVPVEPNDRPAVVVAAKTVDATEKALDDARQAAAAAERDLTAHREGAAARLLEELGTAAAAWVDAGAEGQMKVPSGPSADKVDATLAATLAAARRRLATSEQAVALAKGRHVEALAQAKAEFAAEMKPLLRAGMEEVQAQLGGVVALNDSLRDLAAYGERHGAALPWHPHDIAFPLMDGARLAEIVERRAGTMFAAPAAMPANTVVLRWLQTAMPYAAGETCGLSLDDAAIAVKSLLAEPVDPADHKRMKTTKIVRLADPTEVKITKVFTPRHGTHINIGTRIVLDGPTASRAINLGYAEAA